MFELNGEPVTLEFLQSKAAEYNMDFDSYKEKMKAKGLKEIEPGKTTPPQEEQGATAEVMAAPEIPPTVTDSKQEDISLDLQKIQNKFDQGKFTTAERSAFEEYKKTGKINKDLLPLPIEKTPPTILESLIGKTARGIVSTMRGLQAVPEDIIFAIGSKAMNPEEKKAFKSAISTMSAITPGGVPTTAEYDSLINKINENIRKTENESVTQALENNNYAEAAELAIGGMLESLPSVAAAFTGYGGIALFGASVAGNKFDEEFKNNPKESISTLALNAIGTGATEALFERVTMGIAGRAKAALGRGSVQEATKILKEGYLSAAKNFGLDVLKEGLSEGATEAANIGIDYLSFDRELPQKEILYRITDGAIIGALMGGTITSISEIGGKSTAARNRAEYLLTTDSQKNEMKKAAVEISNLSADLQTAEGEAANVLQQKILEQENKIISIKKQMSLDIEAMDKDQLKQYANNIDLINKKKSINNPPSAVKLANEEINSLIKENENIISSAKEAKLEKTTEAAKKAAEKLNIQLEIFESKKDFEEYLNQNNFSNNEINTAIEADGFISKDGKQIFINKEVAKNTEAVNVASHELLHGVLFQTLQKNPEAALNLGKALSEEILKINPAQIANSVFRKRLELYSADPESVQAEEILTLFADATATGDIKYNENIFTKIGDSIRRILQNIGWAKIKFNTGRDVYNFIKDYNKDISKGGVRQKILKQAIKGFEGKLVDIVKNSVQDVEKFSKSEKASDKVQNIYEKQGIAGALDIINEFTPIVNKLVNKYRDVPGFEFQLLKDEIETGERGILDMIQAYTPEKAKGAPLAGYINKFLARRAIEAANRVLGTEFTLDVTEAKGVTDTITAEETIEREEATIADEIKSLRKEIGLSDDLVNTVKNAVIKTFGTKLPNPQDPKFRFELQKRFRTELKKPISKFVGTRADYENFLRNNFKAIYDKMPQSLINRRFDEFAEPVLDENGKQLRERTAEGNKIFTKKKITPAEWIKYFLGSEVGSSTKGARKTAIVEGIAEEIAFDATMEVLRDPDIIQKYQDIAEITGDILPDNYLAQIAKQIDRNEDFKFSKSILNDSGLSNQELSSILFEGFISAAGKVDPKIIEVLLDNAWIKSFPKVLEEYILPGYANAIKNKTVEEQADISKYLINIISRPLRTISKQTEKLNYNTNYRLFKKLQEIAGNKVFGPDGLLKLDEKIIKYKTGPNKGKFKEKRTYIRDIYGNALGSSTYNTSVQSFHKDLITNKLSREEVNGVFSENRDRLKELIFGLGKENKGLAIALIKLTQKDQRGLLRSSGNIGGIVQNYDGETIFEHRPPVQYLFNKIVDYIKSPTNIKKQKLNTLLDTAQINVVPKDFADIVDQDYKTTIPSDGKISYENALSKTNYEFDGMFKYSKSLNKDFNKILEASTGVKWTETFSPVKAKLMGKGKGKKFFIPYAADDFVGLLYTTLAKGKEGDAQMKWYEENLLRPFSRGIQQYEAAKQKALREWIAIKKEAKKDVPGGLNKVNDTGFRNQDAVRLYIWNKQGDDIPGLLKKDLNPNLKVIKDNPKLKEFADRLIALQPEGYPPPSANWLAGDITTDLVGYINGVKRSEFLTEWKDNVDIIFSEKNMDKLRGLYGDLYVEALDNMLHRMRTGTNRYKGADRTTKRFMDWTNNSVGTIMFFNARSAVLQTLSAVNFINFTDNNPINAGLAFANQKQFWNDFAELWSSDFLKQRRSGLQTDVNADEIARAAATAENKAQAVLSYLLKIGFAPTQAADSFAIAMGGASFYRNRIKKYIKEGLSETEAKKKAFTDFQEIAEETQQSARPDRISMQQASPLGRVILAFGNTPMQYARLTKKAALDLINGRGDWKTNISKIAYYSVIQNIIFSALQQGLFALLFSDEEDDKEKERYFKLGNGMADTLLRGIGVYGAAAATVKNMIFEIIKQEKSKRPNYTEVAIQSTSISPPINSKLRKLISAGKTFTYKQSKEKVFTEGFSLENPAFLAAGQVLSAGINLPADRMVLKLDHLKTAMEPETELWQSIALSLGWSEWDLGMIEKQTKATKKPVKKNKKRSIRKRTLRKK